MVKKKTDHARSRWFQNAPDLLRDRLFGRDSAGQVCLAEISLQDINTAVLNVDTERRKQIL